MLLMSLVVLFGRGGCYGFDVAVGVGVLSPV